MAKKKAEAKPIQLKEVVIKGTAPKKSVTPDSSSVGYGAGKRKFANEDIKQAVKNKILRNVDTTSNNKIQATVAGNSDKADMVSNAVKRAKEIDAFKKVKKK